MRRRKKKIMIVLICILLVILFMVGLYFYGLTPVSKTSDKVTFKITSGTGTRNIINDLYEANIIKSKISTMVYVKLHKNVIIQAGTYEIDRCLGTKEIINMFNKGKVKNDTVTITFIEGKRITDYVKVISENFSYSEDDVIKTMSDTSYLKELINKYDFLSDSILNSDLYYPLEGYLFPATYEFYKSASIKSIIEKMLDKTEEVLDNYNVSLNNSDYDIHEILTMASIIENETMHKEDREIVSQVIYTRLNKNMSLGMDVTTYYGVRKELGETLTNLDINDKNAYNTRPTSFLGLPVGPICNPSEASIKAALNPSDTDYVYFYAEIETGKLHFAKTYSEFQELIRLYS